jgi:AraC family transcriptional regulator, positive regulator of tynA and feaB
VGVWDIAALPPREQFGYWHEVICQAFVPLTPHRTVDEEGFSARVETRPLAGLSRARLRARPQRTDHGPREVARTDGDHYFVNLQLAGRCITTVRGETTVVEPGRFVVVDTTEPYFFHLDRPWQMLSYRLPRSALTEALRGRRPALGRPIDATGAGAAVTALMRALWPLGPTTPGAGDLTDSFAAAVAAATATGPRGTVESPGVTRAAVLAHVVQPRLPAPVRGGAARDQPLSGLHERPSRPARPAETTVVRQVMLGDPDVEREEQP